MTEKQTQPTRLHTLLRGLGTLAAAVGIGVSLLAVIGFLFPHHHDSRVLNLVISVISLAMFGWAAAGIWLIIKAVLGVR
ncbi:MAG: hypothetical protein A2V98_02360 [Planctomycetes bacterium RBG_16_64_12]|nr:MAG: hypothetical protein A2V98_02360 [Planctomycetes bacterium RBG_16_64_12]